MEQNKANLNQDAEEPFTGLDKKEWMKKLELATGKPIQLGGASYVPEMGVSTDPEQRSVQFRCAKTGKIFFVLFMRYSPSHQFQLISVSKKSDKTSGNLRDQSSRKSEYPQKSFDASDFDWTGWFCPHCGHKDTFIECGKCGEYVCGRRIRQLQDGTETFACHDECGYTGEIKGYIKSFKGSLGQPTEPNKQLYGQKSSQVGKLPKPQKRGGLPPHEAK